MSRRSTIKIVYLLRLMKKHKEEKKYFHVILFLF